MSSVRRTDPDRNRPGIDIQTQVLDLMEFTPLISPDLKEMDTAIFMEGAPFGLRKYIFSN